LLPYAFEKSDAKEKWGGENVFAAGEGGARCGAARGVSQEHLQLIVFCLTLAADVPCYSGWHLNTAAADCCWRYITPSCMLKSSSCDAAGAPLLRRFWHAAAVTGGRSLRYTGEVVYGSSCQSFDGKSAAAAQAREEVEQQWSSLVSKQGVVPYFDDVGGAEAWRGLRSGLVLVGPMM
jgi:hypothetical protein